MSSTSFVFLCLLFLLITISYIFLLSYLLTHSILYLFNTTYIPILILYTYTPTYSITLFISL